MDFLNKVTQVLVSKKVALLVEFITSIIVVRYLGLTNFGMYTIAFLIPLFIGSIGSLGLGPSIIYHLNKKGYQANKIFFTFALIGLALGSIYYILINYLVLDILNLYILKDKINVDFLFITGTLIPILLLQKYSRAILRGLYKIKEFTIIIDLLPALIRLPLVLLIILFIDNNLDGIIYVPVIVHGVVTVALIFILMKFISIKFSLLSFIEIKSVLFFGLKNHIGSVIQKSNDQMVMLIVLPILSVEAMGLISLATKLSVLVTSVTSSISTVFAPKVSRSIKEEVCIILPKLTKILFMILGVVSILFMIVLPSFVEIAYGKEFKDVVTLVYILIPGVVSLSIVRMSNNTFTLSGYPLIKSYVRGVGFIFNIILLLLIVDRMGMYAPIISISASYIVMLLISLWLLKRYFSLTPKDILVIGKNEIEYFNQMIKHLLSVIKKKKDK